MTASDMDMAQLLPIFLPLVWASILALAEIGRASCRERVSDYV